VETIGNIINSIISAPFICIGWIIVGAIAGAVARSLMGSRDESFLSDMILGLIGAVVGGFIAGLLGFYRPDGGLELVLINLVLAIIGAIVLIAIGRALTGGRRTPAP
jgi:uncharacterized membrane protein YeaQ/YmgE (transglycosylase-associated protein family)